MKPWRPNNWNKYSNEQPPSGSPNTESFEAGADAVLEGINRDLEEFFTHITDIELALWNSSWGRLQCNAENAQGESYQSWSGVPSEKVSIELIIDAFKLIAQQLHEKEVDNDSKT